jgi:hypothetical protein
MLGGEISQGKGKRTARRVLATDPHYKVEVSFEEAVTLLGQEGMDIGTYVAWGKPDGTLHGEGEGIIALADGDMVSWKGLGAGKFGPGGAVRYVGALTFSTASAKLGKLNSVAGAFEFEVAADGQTQSKIWEWS